MAELFLSAVLPVLFEKLTSPQLLDFATREGVGSKLNKLKKTFQLTDALLVDAEQKQLTDRAVKIWLDELQDLAYDVEDILDEYATEALRRKLKTEEHQASTSTVRKLIPTCCGGFGPSALRSNFSMRSEIDEVTTRLEDLCKRRSELGLENIAGGRSVVSWQRPPTTCFPTETVVHGRDEDKAKVLEMLRSETGDAPFVVVPIVGMGGIGKTTLARQVYNDKAAEDFNLKAWVCISDDFDVVRISKTILESVTGRSCDLKDLNTVQSQLTKVIAGKKFLLVLDDVWSDDDGLWETLRSPFLYGAQGSKIIVTTRLQEVARTVRPKGFYKLDTLSDDECWSLFMQHAFEGMDDAVHWNVEAIRQKVVRKCDGLPLAAKTLGGLLRRKDLEGEWMEILNNKIWDQPRGDKILPVLRLSYYHLPPNLKRCFAYSAIFPKDYEFEEKELVLLWMAEGLIQQSEDNKHLEKLGAKSGGSSLKDLKCLEFLRGQLHISSLENVIEDEDTRKIILSDKDLKVLFLEWGVEIDDSRDEKVDKKVLDMLQPHKNLEELTIRCYGGTKFPSWVGDHNLFSKMTVLALEGCENCTSLPSLGLFGSLKHLTIRKMREVKRISLEFYGEGCLNPFPSLETLLFEDLEEWERWDTVQENEGVESFTKLGELSILQCPKLSAMLPKNLCLLEKLVIRDCAKLVVSVSTFPVLRELEIAECKDIVCSGSPTSSNSLTHVTLSNITDFGSRQKQDFQRVEVLKIDGCDELINLWQNEIFLEKPPQGLHSLISIRTLNIGNCKTLTTLLEGVNQRNAHLENVEIKGCDSLTNIFRGQPPPSLKMLSIEGCEKLQCLLDDDDDESNDCSSSMTFKEKVNSHSSFLDKLEISKCPSFMCLPLTDQFSATLTNLRISDCLKLTTVSLPIALKHLVIRNCPKLTALQPRGQLPKTIETLHIFHCESLESIVERFHNNPALHGIWIVNCNNLKSIPNGLHTLSSLHEIDIEVCRDLVSFPTGGFPNSISRVSISRCEKLKVLPNRLHTLTSLQDLYLSNCPSLSYPEEGFPTNLSSLHISSPNLYKPLNNWRLHNLTSLKRLGIHELSEADSFHEEIEMTLPPTLTHLWIGYFPKLKFLSSKSLENLNSLEWLVFNNCPNLTSLPSLPSSLLELYIISCSLLKEACKKDKGKEWYKIADIPRVEIDRKSIYDPS